MKASLRRAGHAAFHRSYSFLWAFYTRLARALASWGPYGRRDEEYLRLGLKQGVVPRALIEDFERTLDLERLIPVEEWSSPPNYEPNAVYFTDLSKAPTQYLRLERLQLDRLAPIAESLAGPVARCLGYPWRVLNARCWKTPSSVDAIGPNTWHCDGLPDGALKILVYLTPAGRDTGSTEVRLKDGRAVVVEGPPGTWVMFDINRMPHRGLPPRAGHRLAMELIIGPALSLDPRPVVAGTLASCPFLPWESPSTREKPGAIGSLRRLWRRAF